MRLINTKTLKLKEFMGEETPQYAILSHTWGDEEVSLQEFSDPVAASSRKGFAKIKETCRQAADDGLDWAWVDTCCIDKTSSAELSEAINSMYQWYQDAAVCYALLSDVQASTQDDGEADIRGSRWFERGWTLQELLAPRYLEFYDCDWELIGDKSELATVIEDCTLIPLDVLWGQDLRSVNIATKMSWAARRKTTREEDTAYCLFGIFGVNLPLLYGEGPRAFQRLQEEILRTSYDPSIFAWDSLTRTSRYPLQLRLRDAMRFPNHTCPQDEERPTGLLADSLLSGMLAPGPWSFHTTSQAKTVEVIPKWPEFASALPTISSKGLHLELPLLHVCSTGLDHERLMTIPEGRDSGVKAPVWIAVLGCRLASWEPNHAWGCVLRTWGDGMFGFDHNTGPVKVELGPDYQPFKPLERFVTKINVKEEVVALLPETGGIVFDKSFLHPPHRKYRVDFVIAVSPTRYDPHKRLIKPMMSLMGTKAYLICSRSSNNKRFVLEVKRVPHMGYTLGKIDISFCDLHADVNPKLAQLESYVAATADTIPYYEMPEFRVRRYLGSWTKRDVKQRNTDDEPGSSQTWYTVLMAPGLELSIAALRKQLDAHQDTVGDFIFGNVEVTY